ncbi:MAG TPA: hypothetical protein PKB06_10110, partial [Actinotalea sp.]|nr:hypothetical protein [Actinotalea sp.]
HGTHGCNYLLTVNLEMDPLDSDPARDCLFDGYEQALGTSPSNPDTDADGYTDGYEQMHTSAGYDPMEPTMRSRRRSGGSSSPLACCAGTTRSATAPRWPG